MPGFRNGGRVVRERAWLGNLHPRWQAGGLGQVTWVPQAPFPPLWTDADGACIRVGGGQTHQGIRHSERNHCRSSLVCVPENVAWDMHRTYSGKRCPRVSEGHQSYDAGSRPNVCVPPKTHKLRPNSQGDGIWRWGLWEATRSQEWGPHDRNYRQRPQRSPATLPPPRAHEETAICLWTRRPSPDPAPARALILDFPQASQGKSMFAV